MSTYSNFLKDLTKKQLTSLAKMHGMTGYSTLKKDDLADKLELFLRQDTTAKRFFSYLGEDEIQLFLHGDAASHPLLSKRLHEAGYCFIENDVFAFPEDFTPAFLEDSEFLKTAIKNSLLLDCLEVCTNLYGVVPFSKIKEFYEKCGGQTISKEEIVAFIDQLPSCYNHYAVIDEFFMHSNLVSEGLFEKIRLCQGSQPYYIPDVLSVRHMARYGFLRDPHVDKLLTYLTQTKDLPSAFASQKLILIQSIFRQGGTIKEAIENLALDPDADYLQDGVFLSLLNEVFSHTRLLLNRGYTASEKQQLTLHPKKIYPNDPCPCGSGKKYKKCCAKLK